MTQQQPEFERGDRVCVVYPSLGLREATVEAYLPPIEDIDPGWNLGERYKVTTDTGLTRNLPIHRVFKDRHQAIELYVFHEDEDIS